MIAGAGKLPEVLPPTMVVLQADCGSVMRTCEGPFGEAGRSVFGWEKVEIQSKRTEYRGILEICVAQDF